MNTDVQKRAAREFLRRFLFSNYYRRQLTKIQEQAKASGQQHIPVILLNGMTMLVNPNEFIGKRVVRHGTYAYEDIYLLTQLAKKYHKTQVILDISANIGNHSLHFSQHFNRVLSFEPNPFFVQQLHNNLELNHITNVDVYPIGLSDRNGELPYHNATADNPGASGFVLDERQADLLLEVRNGDELLHEAGISQVDVIKLDVEGHEARVLAGLQKTIERDRPIILFEYVPQHMKKRGGFAAIRSQLDGYKIFRPQFSHKRLPFGRLLGPLRGLKFSLQPLAGIPSDHSDLIAIAIDDLDKVNA